jgi:hypothetical protein
MVHARGVALFALLGLQLSSCARAPAPLSAASALAGDWRAGSGGLALDVTLRARGGFVSGYGELRNPRGQNSHWVVTGEYAPPTITLRFISHDRVLGRYVGHLDPDGTMHGVLFDLGLPGDSLVFFRTS